MESSINYLDNYLFLIGASNTMCTYYLWLCVQSISNGSASLMTLESTVSEIFGPFFAINYIAINYFFKWHKFGTVVYDVSLCIPDKSFILKIKIHRIALMLYHMVHAMHPALWCMLQSSANVMSFDLGFSNIPTTHWYWKVPLDLILNLFT